MLFFSQSLGQESGLIYQRCILVGGPLEQSESFPEETRVVWLTMFFRTAEFDSGTGWGSLSALPWANPGGQKDSPGDDCGLRRASEKASYSDPPRCLRHGNIV